MLRHWAGIETGLASPVQLHASIIPIKTFKALLNLFHTGPNDATSSSTPEELNIWSIQAIRGLPKYGANGEKQGKN
jgi:hypothetical protein